MRRGTRARTGRTVRATRPNAQARPARLTTAVPRRRVAAAGAELADGPADLGGVPAQAPVGVDRAGEADLGQDRHVVGGVAVGVRLREVDPVGRGERADRLGLGAAVQHVPDQAAGVVAVLVLGDRAERAGRAQAPGDDLADLARRRRDQPDGVAGGDVLVEQPLGAGVDAQQQDLVVDVLGDRGDLGDRVAGHDLEPALPDLVDLLLVLAERQVPELVQAEPERGRACGRTPAGTGPWPGGTRWRRG